MGRLGGSWAWRGGADGARVGVLAASLPRVWIVVLRRKEGVPMRRARLRRVRRRGARLRDAGVRCAGWGIRGRAPDCQSWRSCSRRSKMRAKMAAIRACRDAGSQPRSSTAGAVERSRARSAAREEDRDGIHPIITNAQSDNKEKIAWIGKFFWRGEE